MEYAMYFLGASFLVLAGALAFATTKVLGAVNDVRTLMNKAPAVIDMAQNAIGDIKSVTREFTGQVDRVKDFIPELKGPVSDVVSKVGSDIGTAGIEAMKSAFSFYRSETSKGAEKADIAVGEVPASSSSGPL